MDSAFLAAILDLMGLGSRGKETITDTHAFEHLILDWKNWERWAHFPVCEINTLRATIPVQRQIWEILIRAVSTCDAAKFNQNCMEKVNTLANILQILEVC